MLDLSQFSEQFKAKALKAFKDADAVKLLGYMDNTAGMRFVLANRQALQNRGIYEAALLHAFTITRTNNLHIARQEIVWLFGVADKEKLREAACELPGPGPFNVYRGVAGDGEDRREDGFSWSDSLDAACWFATRYPYLADPAVFAGTLDAHEVWAFANDRSEREFIGEPLDRKRMDLSKREMRRRAKAYIAMIHDDGSAEA